MSRKKVTKKQFLQIVFYTDMMWTKKAILQQKKTRNHSIQGQFTFGIHLQSLPSKCNTRKIQPKTWDTAIKFLSNILGKYTHQNIDVKKKLQPASFIYVWTIFEHQVNHTYASQNVQVFF